jgi:hypothetical protein
MTHAEIRLIKHLVTVAFDLDARELLDTSNWTAFKMTMQRHRPSEPQFEVTDKQFERCLRAAFAEVNQ